MSFLSGLEPSDWVEIVGIVVNVVLTIWIVRTIQNRLTNRRVLKDYFMNEVKDVRNEYRNCLNNLYASRVTPKTVIPWFKLMNIKVDDMMSILNEKYKISKDMLHPYQIDLRELITNNEDFVNQFKENKPIEFTSESRNSFIKFQQDHNNLFNKIIIAINDGK